MEFWKEHPLNEIDTKPAYQMLTLLVVVLPSPPGVADLNIKPMVNTLNLRKTPDRRIYSADVCDKIPSAIAMLTTRVPPGR